MSPSGLVEPIASRVLGAFVAYFKRGELPRSAVAAHRGHDGLGHHRTNLGDDAVKRLLSSRLSEEPK